MQYTVVKFDDLDAAFEEMTFLVGQTDLSHRIVRRKDGQYRVIPFNNNDDEKDSVCELNIRNVVGERLLNIRRGTKSQKKRAGVQRSVS